MKHKHKHNRNRLWALLGAYGVWFAVISGIEDILVGKYWKAILSLCLGVVVVYSIRDLLKPRE